MGTITVSQATASARELVAELLNGSSMYATLHTSQPQPSDPLASVVRTTGRIALKVVWEQDGAVLINALNIVFTGINRNTTVTWVALCSEPDGRGILFMAELGDPETANASDGVVSIPMGTMQLLVA